jgi:hypothetical protein
MKKYFINSIALIVSSLLLVSCFEAEDKSFNGPEEFQFNNQSLGRIATTIPGITAQTLIAKSVNQATVRVDSVEVQLIGVQKNTALEVVYSVDPTSTAVAGKHYSLVSPDKVTLAPNTSSTYVKYNIISGGIPTGGTPVRFILNLEGAPGIPGGENFKKFTVTITR